MQEKETVEELQRKMKTIDEDNDGTVDTAELAAFLETTGALDVFGASSAAEVMAKFDTDNSGQLDADELAQLRQHLESKVPPFPRNLVVSA